MHRAGRTAYPGQPRQKTNRNTGGGEPQALPRIAFAFGAVLAWRWVCGALQGAGEVEEGGAGGSTGEQTPI